MPTPPPKGSPPPQLRNVKRARGRFTESELARAMRAARASGAERLELDPESGKYSIFFAKPGDDDPAETDLLSKL